MIGSAFHIPVGWGLENINKVEGDTSLVGVLFFLLLVGSSIGLKAIQLEGATHIAYSNGVL